MDKGERSYRRYLNGDDSAFDEVLMLYFDNLVFFLNRYVRDPAAAEDLAMDSFLALLIHPTRYHFKTPLKTYLFTIGRNKALNYLKRRNRFHPNELKETDAVTNGIEQGLLDSEEKRALHTALAALPPEMRSAVHLVYFEDMSYEEAAHVMKKTRKQIDNLLYRAKAALKIQLKGENNL